jgi:hypothetical protein
MPVGCYSEYAQQTVRVNELDRFDTDACRSERPQLKLQILEMWNNIKCASCDKFIAVLLQSTEVLFLEQNLDKMYFITINFFSVLSYSILLYFFLISLPFYLALFYVILF